MKEVLRAEKLCLRYGGVEALKEVSLTVGAGEAVLLVGANGAGKTSFLNSVMGTVKPHSGAILFEGKALDKIPCFDRARLGIGYSPEGRRLFGSLTVMENILIGSSGAAKRDAEQILSWLRSRIDFIHKREGQRANQLSGGEQQIVALARAVSRNPKLLIMDEPFLGLAPIWIKIVSNIVTDLRSKGVTILMAEQMARPALKIVDRAYIIRHGEVITEGPVEKIKGVALSDSYL